MMSNLNFYFILLHFQVAQQQEKKSWQCIEKVLKKNEIGMYRIKMRSFLDVLQHRQ